MENNTDKIVVIPDLHGKDFWKKAVKEYPNHRLIFIGDYFDSFDIPFEQQYKNFMEIIQYKQDNPETILLWANHELHYLDIGEQYSGFQKNHAFDIKYLLKTYADLFQVAYEYDNHIFVHAGISNTWMKNKGLTSIEEINELFKYKPQEFGFSGTNPYGDDVTQGPLWIRKRSLLSDQWQPDKIQVVGHTLINKITRINNLIMIDNRAEECFIVE